MARVDRIPKDLLDRHERLRPPYAQADRPACPHPGCITIPNGYNPGPGCLRHGGRNGDADPPPRATRVARILARERATD